MKNGIFLVVKIACEDSQLANFDLQMCAKKKWQKSDKLVIILTHTELVVLGSTYIICTKYIRTYLCR